MPRNAWAPLQTKWGLCAFNASEFRAQSCILFYCPSSSRSVWLSAPLAALQGISTMKGIQFGQLAKLIVKEALAELPSAKLPSATEKVEGGVTTGLHVPGKPSCHRFKLLI
jgi:hypothetical protein